MEDTGSTPETGTSQPLKNDATQPVAPPTDTSVEELKKQLEQERMEKNLLRNKLSDKEKAEADAKERELAEQNKYKDLWEKERAEKEALQQDREEAERKQALDEARGKVLEKFGTKVRELAEDTGLTLTDVDEASIQEFEAKIKKIEDKIGAEKITPNNPPNRQEQKSDLSSDDLKLTLRDPDEFSKYVMDKYPGIGSMTKRREA